MIRALAIIFVSSVGLLFSSGTVHAGSFSYSSSRSVTQSKSTALNMVATQPATSYSMVESAREKYLVYGNAMSYCYSPKNVVGHWVKDVRGTDHCCSLRSPVAGQIATHPVSDDGFSGLCCNSDEFWDELGNCAKAYAYPPIYQRPMYGDPVQRLQQ